MTRRSVKYLAPFLVLSLIFVGCQENPTAPSPEDGSEAMTNQSAPKASVGSCDIKVPDDKNTIQDAVNNATSGATVCVDGGTYQEQVIITKDLTLAGKNNPIIKPDALPEKFSIAESQGSTWEPLVFAFGGTTNEVNDPDYKFDYDEVSGSETIDVSITGFTIDGREEQPEADRKVGIFFRNVQSTGGVAENEVQNMGVGGKETFGILAYGDTDVTITENTVSGYERGGIGANGDGGDHPAPDVAITNNDILGSTGIEEAWGPNGIQIGFGATGRITENFVEDNRYGDSFSTAISAGILVFGSNGIEVRGNKVSNSDIAVAAAVGENTSFVRNKVKDAVIGAFFFQLNNGKLSNNELSDSDGDPVGTVGVLNTGQNNKLINNTIDGFTTPISNQGDDAKIHANQP